jgi:hypothetical protein
VVRTRFAAAMMDADRLLSFDRYALDLANERNAPQYRLKRLQRTRREDAEEHPRLVSPCCTMPSRRGGFEGGHTVDLAPETARVRHRYRGRLYGKKLKTKNAKRIVELRATLCATLREIRPAKLHQHSLVFTTLRGEPMNRPRGSADTMRYVAAELTLLALPRLSRRGVARLERETGRGRASR